MASAISVPSLAPNSEVVELFPAPAAPDTYSILEKSDSITLRELIFSSFSFSLSGAEYIKAAAVLAAASWEAIKSLPSSGMVSKYPFNLL